MGQSEGVWARSGPTPCSHPHPGPRAFPPYLVLPVVAITVATSSSSFGKHWRLKKCTMNSARVMTLSWPLSQDEGILREEVPREGLSWGWEETPRAKSTPRKAPVRAAHHILSGNSHPKAPWGCHTRLHGQRLLHSGSAPSCRAVVAPCGQAAGLFGNNCV